MPLVAMFVIVLVSLVIVRIGATALIMTGLSRPVAEFQAISCFFGVGFTTAEAEMIVSHPVRRRIASHLIIAGNVGLTTALGAVLISFLQDDRDFIDNLIDPASPGAFFVRLGFIFGGVAIIVVLFRRRVVKDLLDRIIRASLARAGVVRALDYELVLHSKDGFAVAQTEIEAGHPLIGATLAQSALGSRGVLVLGIERRDRTHIGAPDKDTAIQAGDLLTVYGKEASIHAALDLPRNAPHPPGESTGRQPPETPPVE